MAKVFTFCSYVKVQEIHFFAHVKVRKHTFGKVIMSDIIWMFIL